MSHKHSFVNLPIPMYLVHFNIPINVGILGTVQQQILELTRKQKAAIKIIHIASSQNMESLCEKGEMVFLEKESILLFFTPKIRKTLSRFFPSQNDFEIFEEQFQIIEREFSLMPGMCIEETMFP